jgi:hypothetical protein
VQDFTYTFETSFTQADSIKSSLTGNTIRFVDYDDNCYFADGGRPQIYNGTTVRNMGVDSPGTAPTISPSGTGSITGAYYAKVTFVNADGVESNPSAASTVANASSDAQFDWTNIPTLADHNRRIYRTEAGGVDYYLVDEIEDDTTTTYTDTLSDVVLAAGTLLVTTNNVPPDATIIHVHKNIMFFVDANDPRKVWNSKVAGNMEGYTSAGLEQVPGADATYPYFKIYPNTVTALSTFANALIVSGEGFTKAVYGSIFGGASDDTSTVDIDTIGALSHEAVKECIDPNQRNILLIATKQGVKYLTRGLQDNSLEAAPLSYPVQRYFDNSTSRSNQTAYFHNSRFYIAITHVESGEAASATNNKVLVYDFRTNQWYPYWTINSGGFAEANGLLYCGDSTKGIIYQMNTGSDDNGENIEFVIDLSQRFDVLVVPTILEVIADTDSVTDSLNIYTQVDNTTKTLTPGAKSTWTQSNSSEYGKQDAMISQQQKIGARGYFVGLRISDDSTNPIIIYELKTRFNEGVG